LVVGGAEGEAAGGPVVLVGGVVVPPPELVGGLLGGGAGFDGGCGAGGGTGAVTVDVKALVVLCPLLSLTVTEPLIGPVAVNVINAEGPVKEDEGNVHLIELTLDPSYVDVVTL
jgi:hypothetical protein